MAKRSSAKWPVYRGAIGTPLDQTANLSAEIPARLSGLCALYGIDQRDPVWERKLLLTLAHRHVKGFWVRKKRRAAVDNAALIELIDEVRSALEDAEGRRLSIDSVVSTILENPDAKPWLGSVTQARALRIYSDRKRYLQRARRDLVQQGNDLAKVVCQSVELNKTPTDSYARIFRDLWCKRQS